MSELVYRPRNDFCLIRASKVDVVRGPHMPQVSAEAEKYHVVAVGPKVGDDLKPGDRVLMTGSRGVDWSAVPGNNNLIVIREANIVLVAGEGEGDGE